MKVILRIAGFVLTALLLGTGCKKEKSEVKPIDSTQILPPGKVEQIIVSSGETFIDTGVMVTIKGKGFDPNMRNRYFLFARDESVRQLASDSIIYRDFKSNQSIKDTNLISIDESTIVFKLPKYSISNIARDSAFVYFAKHTERAVFYNENNNTRTISTVIAATKGVINIPIYKQLKDTLVISKKYSSLNKEMIQGCYFSESIKVMIQGLEYSSKDEYFVDIRDYSAPFYKYNTISMVATYDKFYLPDGSYSFEIYERDGNQRKFVEETGKTKIYIKNVP